MPTLVFRDFDRAIDRLHALFDGWDAERAFEPVLGLDGSQVLRLVVHEWIANLVQHATWREAPEIVMEIGVDGDAVRCSIEDTSAGFDLVGQLEHQQSVLNAPAPSERGRGLLMLVTCAEDLAFRPAGGAGRQRVAFALRDPAGGNLGALFREADLEPAAEPAWAFPPGDGADTQALRPPRP